jgi:hypothetical protein
VTGLPPAVPYHRRFALVGDADGRNARPDFPRRPSN